MSSTFSFGLKTVGEFFETWGLGKFDAIIEQDSFGKASATARLTVKNFMEYFPVAGTIMGCAVISDLIYKRPNVPHVSTAAKVGLVAHSILGIFCVGWLCFPFDVAASIIRAVHSLKPMHRLSDTGTVADQSEILPVD